MWAYLIKKRVKSRELRSWCASIIWWELCDQKPEGIGEIREMSDDFPHGTVESSVNDLRDAMKSIGLDIVIPASMIKSDIAKGKI